MDSNHRYPASFLAAPSIPAQFTFRKINRLARDSDQWFESISLQRRVSCEPDLHPPASARFGDGEVGPRLWLVVKR